MITRNCVFVVGAGASQIYGFPSGGELKNCVLDLLKNPGEIFLNAFGKSQIDLFFKSFLQSGNNSVDAFLENREDFSGIGKFAISKIIAEHEQVNKLFDGGNEGYRYQPHDYRIKGDWLQYLFELMRADFNEFSKNDVQFVTYNYDRIIETYLFESLKNSFGKSNAEVANVVNSFKIIHLHGMLGYLPWQNAEETRKKPFGQHLIKSPSELVDDIRIGATEIKIIHEANPDSPEFNEARKILDQAKSIIFLGFGFAPQNIERLHIGPNHKNIKATCMGMSLHEVAGIVRDNFSLKTDIFLNNSYDCLELLRNLDRGTFKK